MPSGTRPSLTPNMVLTWPNNNNPSLKLWLISKPTSLPMRLNLFLPLKRTISFHLVCSIEGLCWITVCPLAFKERSPSGSLAKIRSMESLLLIFWTIPKHKVNLQSSFPFWEILSMKSYLTVSSTILELWINKMTNKVMKSKEIWSMKEINNEENSVVVND